MVSAALVLISAALSMQASDTTRASREAFTRCLQTFVDGSVRSNKTLDRFNAEFPQACAAEQAAFRNAIIARDTASRATRAGAEDAANLEIEDARFNFNDRFQMSLPPSQTAQAPAPAQPAPQTAAQTAAPPTAQPTSQPH